MSEHQTSSQQNFLECAEIYERAAAEMLAYMAEKDAGRLERHSLSLQRDTFLMDAKKFRELAE